ncbi:MAG: hypothetical protein Q8O67_01010 [Deltaproteobacteria bacterium]|nr:hypothetical protein [Deltaproteobacteria bacterium]
MTSSLRSLVVLVVLCLASSGCAFTRLTLLAPVDPPAAVRDRGQGRTVVVVPWLDARPQPHRCGMKRNGYGFETVNVYCADEPGELLATRLRAHLQAAGFRVIDVDDDAAASADWRVEGVLRQLFVEPDVGFLLVSPETDIEVDLLVTRRGGLRARRTFYVKHIESSLVPADAFFQRSFEAGVRKEGVVVVAALIELMDRPLAAEGSR